MYITYQGFWHNFLLRMSTLVRQLTCMYLTLVRLSLVTHTLRYLSALMCHFYEYLWCKLLIYCVHVDVVVGIIMSL